MAYIVDVMSAVIIENEILSAIWIRTRVTVTSA